MRDSRVQINSIAEQRLAVSAKEAHVKGVRINRRAILAEEAWFS
jgi:hypothetical protein